MLTHNLGYPRIGEKRDLKRLVESYWNDEIDQSKLMDSVLSLKKSHWIRQKKIGLDLVPSNDFSLYDQVLDMSMLLGAIPKRYEGLFEKETRANSGYPIDTYFAMARGLQDDRYDIPAMEMTKWFNTNYHYIVPEFSPNQQFRCLSSKVFDEYEEARSIGIETKPVLIGPISFLLLGKEKGAPQVFHRLDLLDSLIPIYQKILRRLADMGVGWVQIDEPYLVMDLDEHTRSTYKWAYKTLCDEEGKPKLLLTTYFEGLGDNIDLACQLSPDGLHLDLVEDIDQLDPVLDNLSKETSLSLGLINGRNIWKTDLGEASAIIQRVEKKLGADRLMFAPSCSLLHCPVDLNQEVDERILPQDIKRWMAFADQKLDELVLLKQLVSGNRNKVKNQVRQHQVDVESKSSSMLVYNDVVRRQIKELGKTSFRRNSTYLDRKIKQQKQLNLPKLFPTTTIGSFPQTGEVRQWRSEYRKGNLTKEDYEGRIKKAIATVIKLQDKIGLDLFVHGEFERNDMVEYFGEHLAGFTFTQNGWVQSYGTRTVKPPIIYGDVYRSKPITVQWSAYAQSLTDKPVKGMLTGPVTILQWSFVRDDQPRSETARQIAIAIRDEVNDLEEAGIKAIQIDEPAFREGLPLHEANREKYLNWAVEAFQIASGSVSDQTQIHTHMCYSEFNDIIEYIARMDADVISIETSRSQMELLDAFVEFDYPNEIGPGVYDIHSPRIPSTEEMISLLEKAAYVLDPEQIWVNPDCGLKTRGWYETTLSLMNMVEAVKKARKKYYLKAEFSK